MKNPSRLSVFSVALLMALMGVGCAQQTENSKPIEQPVSISNPQPLTLQGLNPKEAAKRTVFTRGNVVRMHASFTGVGKALALGLGLGESVEREIVIRRFAPNVVSDIEWKATTTLSTPTAKNAKHESQMQYVGAVLSGNLRDAHALLPPIYWHEGDSNALGSGLLWLSQDVYEDLAKIHTSTLKFGLEDGQFLEFASSTPELRQSIRSLQAEIVKVIDRNDVFATTATTGTRGLIVNGAPATVEVLIAKNWFGEIQVLNNPQNPLVLSMRIGKPGGIEYGGLFDYDITELKDLQQ